MGTLWRSAYLIGADFIFTIGHRYKHQPTDTLKSTRHVPLFNFPDWEVFKKSIPESAEIVIIEQGGELLQTFNHPQQAVYVLGSEDKGIPPELLRGNRVAEIESTRVSSYNVAVAGSIVLHDRLVKCL